ncbi:MAG: benzoyl-CoA-dihydrodiol lyase, partial [Nocardioidaceae bacterium]|nr:benzoyl-CoA-dihydrodiol lyase [Nocardioidaceae bacterium]
MTVLDERQDSTDAEAPATAPVVDFDTAPDRYKHWSLSVDGEIATVTLTVDEDAGLVPGYALKMNSYDLGVDIELYDAVQRLRFEHPEVKAVVLTGGLEKMFCAGANIRMLAQSTHQWKVNFCKFTNETRNGIEDAGATSGQTWIAALNGTAAGGGYEMALACDEIILIDDGSSTVSLPEVPLLGVLPGTGGLTRVVDKRHVRKDRADLFATKSEGYRGSTAVEWGLVDATVPRNSFSELVTERATERAASSSRPGGQGVELTPLDRTETDDAITYPHVRATLDRTGRRVAIEIDAPTEEPPADAAAVLAAGVDYWPMALARELDDLILRLRTNENELGTWVFRTKGDADLVAAYDAQLTELKDDWFVNEVTQYLKRTFKRLDVTSRSLIAVIEPGSCFVGLLAEVALACDRQYMLDGVYEDPGHASGPEADPATVRLTASNDGTYPMGNGISRLESRFWGRPDDLEKARSVIGDDLDASAADAAGLVTLALDDIDFEEELRIVLEERAS